MTKNLATLAAFGALFGQGCSDPSVSIRDVPRGGVYSEFLSAEQLGPFVPLLSLHGTTLSLRVNRETDRTALGALLRVAQSRGVSVRLWPLLPSDNGYWVNETNIDAFSAEVTAWMDWIDQQDLAVDTFVYDVEPTITYSEQIRAAFAEGLPAAKALLATHLDPAAFALAKDEMIASVEAVQARGFRVACVTYPQVLDDFSDADDDLQDALDVPIRDVPFDEVGFMVYQTAFGEQFGGAWLGPGLITDFATTARAEFGDRAVIALGQIGTPGAVETRGPTYPDPDSLAADVRAVRAAGIPRVEVYSLDGIAETTDQVEWLTALAATPNSEPLRSPTSVQFLRAVVQDFDRSLDASQ